MPSGHKGLGRGLGALLGEDSLRSAEGGVQTLRITDIEPGRGQPRKHFDPVVLQELTESIRMHGVLQPLIVRRLPSGYYQIIAGERRWRAARLAGLAEVPVLVFEADDMRAHEIALIENLQRADLNPLEEAEGFERLMGDFGLTQEEVAERVGRSRPAVANALRLLTLSSVLRDMVASGALSAGHARALLALPDEESRERLARQVVTQGLSVRQTEALAKKMRAAPAAPPPAPSDEARDLTRRLTEQFGRRVNVVQGKRQGKLELYYYGEKDLQTLLDALGLCD